MVDSVELTTGETQDEGTGREGCFEQFIWGGDSGSPVWVEGTGVAVGLAVTGSQDPDEPGFRQELIEEKEKHLKEKGEFSPEALAKVVEEVEKELREEPRTCFVLLSPPPGTPGDGTVFGDPYLAPLHLVTKTNAQP